MSMPYTRYRIVFTRHAKERWIQRIDFWDKELATDLVARSRRMTRGQKRRLAAMVPWRRWQILSPANKRNYRIFHGIVFICHLENDECRVITVYQFDCPFESR